MIYKLGVAQLNETTKWRRDCKYANASVVKYGCTQHDFGINGKTIQVDECVCDTDECNRVMGPIDTTSTAPTTTHKGIPVFFFKCEFQMIQF